MTLLFERSATSARIERLVVVNDLSLAKGGASGMALLSAKIMRSRGIPVTILTGDDGQNAELTALGIDIVALGRRRLRDGRSAAVLVEGLYNRAAFTMVADWIAANDTTRTVYHLHGWMQILSPAVFKALRPVRDRLILSAHDFFLVCPNGAFAFLKTGKPCTLTPLGAACLVAQCDRSNYAEKLWRVARQAIQRHFYQPDRSPPVLAVHAAMIPLLLRGGIPHAAVSALPNPVIAYSDQRIPAERNHELLFVGRLEHSKGPDLALAAARAAGLRLRVVGDGTMRANLEQRYPEMIFAGAQPPGAIGKLAASARLLLMPSRYPEPFGLVAVEALWSGIPVVLPSTACLADEVTTIGAGVSYAGHNVEAIAAILRSLAMDDARVAQMSIAGFERTGGLALSPDIWGDRLIAIYGARLDATAKR